MAKRTAKANTQAETTRQAKETTHTLGFTLRGVLESVFVGKKYAFADIRVDKSNGYYDKLSVSFDLETDFPDDGDEVNVCGTFTIYQGKPSFYGTAIEKV